MAVLGLFVLALATYPQPARSRSPLLRGPLLDVMNPTSFQADLRTAMGTILGCQGYVGHEPLEDIERALRPIWNALPKNSFGRVERRVLRYLAHRYFMQKSSILVRGFEYWRPVNQTDWSTSDVLSGRIPFDVESMLESDRAVEEGFSLEDAASIITILEQVISDTDTRLLETVFMDHRRPLHETMSVPEMRRLLEEYMVHWIVGDDPEGINRLLTNQTHLETGIRHWKKISQFVHGQIKALQFERQRMMQGDERADFSPLDVRFTYHDALDVVRSVTKSFGSYWHSECDAMKDTLVKLDTHDTGRVPLSKFYMSVKNDAGFAESEAYLRQIGALDETSHWRGNQLIIPNYIAALSNCIVTTSHYFVCCTNACDARVSEIEQAVGAPAGTVAQILAIVGNMSTQATLDDDTLPRLDQRLTSELERIAAANRGRVPLHGRLFAQWMHYVFTRDCPFPHTTGNVSIITPAQFGDEFLATDQEMAKHAEDALFDDVPLSIHRDELDWMSQWNPAEETVPDRGGESRRHSSRWECPEWLRTGGAVGFALAGLFGAANSKMGSVRQPRSHMV